MLNWISRSTKKENAEDKLVSFTVATVPSYLHSSEFYKSLNRDDEEEITLHLRHFKQDTNVRGPADTVHLLHTLRFWGSSEIPTSLLSEFSLNSSVDIPNLRDQFGDSFETVNFLCGLVLPGTNRVNLALEKGYFQIVQQMIDQGENWDVKTACKYAAMSGKLECLRYIHEKGGILDISVCKMAIQCNSLECLQYAIENGVTVQPKLNYLAASLGNLLALQFMYNDHQPGTSYKWGPDTCRAAVENNHIECLKYAHEHGAPWDTECAAGAAASGHLHILKYLHAQGCPWSIQATNNAAYHNHLDCLIYLHENGCPWGESTAANAAMQGHIKCLEYVCENNCPLGTLTMELTAEKGNFEMVLYLFNHGCPLSEKVFMWAARFGNVEIMHFLVGHDIVMENNCRSSAIELASRHGHVECLKFAVEYRSPVLPATPPSSYVLLESMAIAAEYGYVECLKYVHEVYHQPHGAAGFLLKSLWPTQICNKAATNGHVECLKYAHEVGCPWEVMTPSYAAAAGKIECLKYLIENGCPSHGISTLRYYANTSNSTECKDYVRRLDDSQNPDLCSSALQHVPNARKFTWRRFFKKDS